MSEKAISERIRERIYAANDRFWASDNISAHILPAEKIELINELTVKFEAVLDSLVIDQATDPSSQGTPRRLARLYVEEIMSGRYEPSPHSTSFPNDSVDRYDGMLVVRSELHSLCSHHHQPVVGVAYIGIVAGKKLIGLSKYSRIAQWCARRGTLQEELCNEIANQITKATGSENIGVYIEAEHGCVTNRGIMAHNSTTQTTVLKGIFKLDAGTKKEFFDNILLQSRNGN